MIFLDFWLHLFPIRHILQQKGMSFSLLLTISLIRNLALSLLMNLSLLLRWHALSSWIYCLVSIYCLRSHGFKNVFNQKPWSLFTHGFIASSLNSSCVIYLHSYLSYEIDTSSSCSFFIHLSSIKHKLHQTPWPLSNYWLHPFIGKNMSGQKPWLSSVMFYPWLIEYTILHHLSSFMTLFLIRNNRENYLFFISSLNLIEMKI